MTRPDDVAPVPDLYLERYRLGELPEDERDRIERLLVLDPELRDRLEALQASDAEVARDYPAPLMDERIRARARAEGVSRRTAASGKGSGGWMTALAAARRAWVMPALAAAAVVLAVGVGVVRPPAPDDGILLKGGAAELVVYRKTAAGDLVRVGYRAAGQPYGAILSTDGNGNVTLHMPRSGGRATSLAPGATVLLDFSYELDDAPRWERFYLVTGDEPFPLEPVRRAARAVATAGSPGAPPPLPLDGELDQSVFTLSKESVP
jgi:hypothetical protein